MDDKDDIILVWKCLKINLVQIYYFGNLDPPTHTHTPLRPISYENQFYDINISGVQRKELVWVPKCQSTFGLTQLEQFMRTRITLWGPVYGIKAYDDAYAHQLRPINS